MSSSSVSLGRNLVSLKWEDFNMFVVSELSALYQKDDLTDVTLFCEGRSFRAHKVLLSLWSSYFRDIFRSTSHSHPVVILKETNSSDLELILRFIYQGHLLIPIEETDRFLKTAEHFQVAGLKNMRNHVPNFNYSSSSNSGSSSNIPSSFHDENASQQQQQHVHSAYDAGAQVTGGGGANLSSSSSQHHQQQTQSNQHFSRGNGSNGSAGSVSTGNIVLPPHPPHSAPLSAPVESPSHHQSTGEASNHQQVIRQGCSSRPPKHVPANLPPPPASGSYSSPSPLGFQPTSGASAAPANPGSSGSANVGVVTRVGNESVIYQPQPVLIFQNGLPPSGGVPILKGEQQYIARSVGEGSRQEHSMMVIEGVISDPSVHIESSTPSHNTVGGAPYTVYAHSSSSPAPNPPPHTSVHHSSPEVPNNEEVILGLPYNGPPPHTLHREVVEDPPPIITSQTSHHHSHSHIQAQHISHHHHSHPADSHVMEMDTSQGSVVVNHPYTPSSSSYESPIPNGNSSASSSSSNSSIPSSSKIKGSSISNPDPPTVYAVKRLPPPLPPSTPTTPPSSRSFKGSAQIKPTILSPKSKTSPSIQGHSGHSLNESSSVATRSKSTGVKVLTPNSRSSSSSTSPQINVSSSSLSGVKEDNLGKNYQAGSSSSASSSTSGSSSVASSARKVVLVPCPKCGKKVKSTSLKVHIKRTHLDEGTVLVCPICSKRISSKGVYYKHMYIHRKRSEVQKSPATATSIIKPETQGT